VKKASDAGKCFDPAVKDVRLPQHATLQGYEQNIEWNIHRWLLGPRHLSDYGSRSEAWR